MSGPPRGRSGIGPNLVLRFQLELVAFGAPAAWGFHAGGAAHVAAGVAGSLVIMVVWGTFRVPHDPGPAPVRVPGPLRLAIEVVAFTLGVLALAAAGWRVAALAFGALVLLHHALGFQRTAWLLRGR